MPEEVKIDFDLKRRKRSSGELPGKNVYCFLGKTTFGTSPFSNPLISLTLLLKGPGRVAVVLQGLRLASRGMPRGATVV